MLEEGRPAPLFELPDANLAPVRLSDFHGRRHVLLVFYPFAFTRVCGGELRAIQDDLEHFQNECVQVLAISVDSVMAQRVFAEQEGLHFPMLSDFWPHGAVAQSYGAFDDVAGTARRATFLIDRDGLVRWSVRTPLPTARDTAAYREALDSL
ncbi:MAG: peroxiredoxin [Actinomycetota bacterium]|nr:peroxiredoxin [Actinomycetota bacterium]